ncbi:MAG TPA: ABC transporter substrate binding protein [Methylomirabilota bacterium]|nr:ABC transporter substrate binding protein [Methylomirabilota bacterium]
MLGVKVHPVEIRQAEELDDAIVRAQAKGLIVFADLLTFSHRQRIVQTASQRGLATASGAREFVGAGGVLSYGPSFPEMFRHAAMYVDKLLNGAKAAELPVEQPTQFELVLNLKTAKRLGLTMPQTLLLRADQIVE